MPANIFQRNNEHILLEKEYNSENSFISNINILVSDLENIDYISQYVDSIDTVATNIDAVSSCVTHIDSIENVHSHINDILLTNSNLRYILPVGENITSVITTANNIDAVKICNNDISSIVKVANENIPELASQIHSDRLAVDFDKSVVERLRSEVALDTAIASQKADKAASEASRATLQANLANDLRQQTQEFANQAKTSTNNAYLSEIACDTKLEEVSRNTQITLENTEAARIYSFNANISKEEAKTHADKAENNRLLTDKNLQDDTIIHLDILDKYNKLNEIEDNIYKSEELTAYYRERAKLSEYHAGNYFKQCEYLAFYSKDYHDRTLEAIETTKEEVTNKVNEISSYKDIVVEKASEVSNNTEIVKELELANKEYSEEVASDKSEIEIYKNEVKELKNTIVQLLDNFNTKVSNLEETIREYEEEYEYRKNSGFVSWLQYIVDSTNSALLNLLQSKRFITLKNSVNKEIEKISLSFNSQMAENDLTDLIQSRRIGVKQREPIPISYFDDDSDGDSSITSPTSIGMGSLGLELDDGTIIPMNGLTVTP